MKSKVSYEKAQRDQAKREGKGLVTIDIVRTDGSRSTIQVVASDSVQRMMDYSMLKLIDGKS